MTRGRLSSIEQLPVEAVDDVRWLHNEIVARRLSQGALLGQFNARLAAKGLPSTSRSTLHRYVERVLAGEVAPPAIAPATGRPLNAIAADLRSIADELTGLRE